MAEIEQSTIPTLYNLSSSQALRVLWALEEVAGTNDKFKYNLKNVPRKNVQDLKATFPLGKSPILTLEPVNGESATTYQFKPNTLTESRLILQFISDNYTNGTWVPKSEEDTRRDTFFQEFANATLLAKVDFALLFEVVTQPFPFGLRHLLGLLVSPIVNHFRGDQRDIYQLLEESLSDERPWFSGPQIGLADINMSFGMDMAAQRGYFEAKKYPKLAQWHETVQDRPAYKRALEKGGKYDLVNFT
jgi:glutathione S-transferase